MYYGFVSEFYYPRPGAGDLVAWGDSLQEVIQKTLSMQGCYTDAEVYGADDSVGLILEWSSTRGK